MAFKNGCPRGFSDGFGKLLVRGGHGVVQGILMQVPLRVHCTMPRGLLKTCILIEKTIDFLNFL